MPCFLVFLRYDDQRTYEVDRIELTETQIQRAMSEAKLVYQAQLKMAPKQNLQSPRLVCGTRNIPLHLAPMQVQPFSLQM